METHLKEYGEHYPLKDFPSQWTDVELTFSHENELFPNDARKFQLNSSKGNFYLNKMNICMSVS